MLSQNQICQPIKKITTRINCDRCNKPNMSKKNISAHYKAGCSGIWNQFTKPKESKEPKEKKPRQPRKPRNKNISFSCSDFIDFTNWLIDNQIILDEEDNDYFLECYQQFRSSGTIIPRTQGVHAADTVGLKNNQEPPEPTMIIKITYPWAIQKSVQESVHESIEEIIDQPVEQSVEESVQFGDIYPSFEEESFKEENEMVLHENITPEIPQPIIKKPTKLKLSKPRREKSIEKDVCNVLNWSLLNHKPKIDPEDKFFLEDENIENEFPDNTEEHIQYKLDKFMERLTDKEIKNYTNDQKKRIEKNFRKEKEKIWELIRMSPMELYKNKYNYNFINRNLRDLIKAKIDKLEEDSKETFNKNKILEKYKDKFNHWMDRARDTYEIPKSYEWTITTRDAPLEQMAEPSRDLPTDN